MQHAKRLHLTLLAILCCAHLTSANAQQLESTPRPEGEPRPTPYLSPDTIDYRLILAPPPEIGSTRDHLDRIEIETLQRVSTARWHIAETDDAFVYPRFAVAFGHPIDRHHTPTLIQLLNRAIRDVGAPTFQAKDHYNRPRPYQRFQLQRVCGVDTPPKPEPTPAGGSSYPSGHAAYGWTVALILAQLAPDRAPQLLQRAADYAESRAICAVHYPTDLEAGRALAIATVNALNQTPQYKTDLAQARTELNR